jgi:hypothetical protein
MRKTIALAAKLLAIALAGGAPPLAARSAELAPQWEYRVLTKSELLDLGKKDLAAGLNKLGDEGWELAAVDTAYIFKRPKAQAQAAVVRLRLKAAEADVEQQRERVQWSQRMVKKGFVAPNQLKEELRLLRELEIVLEEAEAEAKRLPPEPKKATEADRKPEK